VAAIVSSVAQTDSNTRPGRLTAREAMVLLVVVATVLGALAMLLLTATNTVTALG